MTDAADWVSAAGDGTGDHRRVILSDLLDRVLDTGVVLVGDLFISVAEVELLYVGLRVVIGPADIVGPGARRRAPASGAGGG